MVGKYESSFYREKNFKLYALVYSSFILVIVVGFDSDIHKYCREKERLVTSEELDKYLLVDAEINTTLSLDCHFCNEETGKDAKVWYYQNSLETTPEREVYLGTSNNMSENRIHTSPRYSLVIRNFGVSDAGIYRCRGENSDDAKNKFNYRIEIVYKVTRDVEMAKGNLSDWEKYREINLETVTTRFAVSRMLDLLEIRHAGVTLEVISEWTPWSACEKCVRKRGVKTSKGQCRLKSRVQKKDSEKPSRDKIVQFFSKSPLLACRSQLLEKEFPLVSRATRDLPEFILEEKCNNCTKVKKQKKGKFKYKKRYTLAQGAHLAIACPETTMETKVVWRKDSLELHKGLGRSFRKRDADPRVLVDTFATLYLIDVSTDEEGNYTCYVDNVRMLQVQVNVVSKSRLLTHAFFRHMGYLGFIFLLTSFCYCGGLFIVCKEKHKFKIKDPKDVEENES